MKILKLDVEKSKATVELSRTELGYIVNALYLAIENSNGKGGALEPLKHEITVAKDILDYGHVDDFTITQKAKSMGYVSGIHFFTTFDEAVKY